MKKLCVVILVLVFFGCEKEEPSPFETFLVGKWQLSEFCVSPGDTSCPRQNATAISTQTLEFFGDGTFTEKTPQRAQFGTPIFSSGKYRIDPNDMIAFKFDDRSVYKEEVIWQFNMVTNFITRKRYIVIRPGVCIEPCEFLYKEVK